MKLNEHEKARPNFAGLTSREQQSEMKRILGGKWPPLKPFPVFKYGTDEYRAEIYFDRTRGEWVCRKTCLLSNKVQELRGGLTEMTLALPRGQAEGSTEGVTAEQQDQESESEADRRFQVILDWRRNYENGALYSELQDYLSESQQDEIHDCIRMSLTAWQLQFNPKNIAFVFEVLCNAGGRLSKLLEIAQRNKAQQETNAHAQTKAATLEAEGQASVEAIYESTCSEEAPGRHEEAFPSESADTRNTPVDETKPKQGPVPVPVPVPASTPTDSAVTMAGSAAEISIGDVPQNQETTFMPEHAKNFLPEPSKTIVPGLSEGLTSESVENALPTVLENLPTEPIGRSSLAQVQSSSAELIARLAARASQVVAREILGASPVSHVEGLQEKGQYHTAVAGFGAHVLTDRLESSADRIGDSPTQLHASEISAKRGFGFRLGAFVFLAIGFTIGFTVGLNTPAIPPETEESPSHGQSAQSRSVRPNDAANRMRATDGSSTATSQSDPSIHSDSLSSGNKLDGATRSEEKPKESGQDAVSLAKVPATDSTSSPTVESRRSRNSEPSPEANGSTGLIARDAPPLPMREPAHSPKAVDQVRGATRHAALRRVTIRTPRPSPPSPILVTPPGEGSKSLRLTFPEKPIAASSSFAITSQISVLVPPEPGPAVAHTSARLQAGQLISYVWPRHPRVKDRNGSPETVRVRATIGQHGEVLDVKRVSGSISFLPDAIGAIRQWRYKPTLLNKRPVPSQLDVTIEFRPLQYLSNLSQVSTPDPSPN